MSKSDPPEFTGPRVETDEYHVPNDIKRALDESWVIWNSEIKRPLAPWSNGHLFPAQWSEDNGHPGTTYDRADAVAHLPQSVLINKYSMTPTDLPSDSSSEVDTIPPKNLLPTVALPHDPPEPPVLFVDLDDVRDPHTGRVSQEVAEIIDLFDAYTEISSSGSGLHLFLRASLPTGLGKFIADLNEQGMIEMYDHGRFVGATWQHAVGTPLDRLPSNQSAVDDLIEKYATEKHKTRLQWSIENEVEVDEKDSNFDPKEGAVNGGSDSACWSPYHDLPIRDVANTGKFSRFRHEAPGGEWQGPHPTHGAASGPAWDAQSNNFKVYVKQDRWQCFYDNVGGDAIALIPVITGIIDCEMVPMIYQDAELYAVACKLAEEKFAPSVLKDANPPYRALAGVMQALGKNLNPEEIARSGLEKGIARGIWEDIDVTELRELTGF